jgi:hypothetical protein
MAKPGPKGAEAMRAESALIPGAREPVPRDLEPDAAVIWEATTIRLPGDFFTSEMIPILKAYCRHSAFADYFAREITATRAAIEALERAISHGKSGIRKLPKLRASLHDLHKLHAHESSHAVSCATRLRITNQSRFVPERAASKSGKTPSTGLPPWHDWGAHASDTEN